MAKCADCGRKISYFNPFRLVHNCTKCGVQLCGRCIITSERGQLCRGCHFQEKKGCFIATACFGIQSEEVEILRNWRDKRVLINGLGRSFIHSYYRISPPIAEYIKDKPALKKMVRWSLFPLIRLIK
jgi:hypothetical protein